MRLLKWILLIKTAVLLIAFVISLKYTVMVIHGRWDFFLRQGFIDIGRSPDDFNLRLRALWPREHVQLAVPRPRITHGPTGAGVEIPLLFILIPALLGGILIRRKRPRAGLCGSCAYDLTGNTSGICPECGKSTQFTKQSGDMEGRPFTAIENGTSRTAQKCR